MYIENIINTLVITTTVFVVRCSRLVDKQFKFDFRFDIAK